MAIEREGVEKQGLILTALLSPVIAATLLIASAVLLLGSTPVPTQSTPSLVDVRIEARGYNGER